MGRPADLRGPFHLRAIRTGPVWPQGAGAFPTAGPGWAPPTEPQRIWTTGSRSHCRWGSRGRDEGPVFLHTWVLQVPPTPETRLRTAASPASGALLDSTGSLTFPAQVLCLHPSPAPPMPQLTVVSSGGFVCGQCSHRLPFPRVRGQREVGGSQRPGVLSFPERPRLDNSWSVTTPDKSYFLMCPLRLQKGLM